MHYTLDRPPTPTKDDGSCCWKGSTGFVNKDMIEKHVLGTCGKDKTQVLMCGPPGMLKFAYEPALKELGYGAEKTLCFRREHKLSSVCVSD